MSRLRIGSTYVRTSSLLLGFICAVTFASALGHAAGSTALTAAHTIYLPLIRQALPGRLVFTATQNGISQIVTMQADGTGRTRLSPAIQASTLVPHGHPMGDISASARHE